VNRLGWMIILVLLAVVSIKFYKQPSESLSNIMPMQCSCSLDGIFSSGHQKKIIQSIQELHQIVKNPKEIIEKTVQEFPEIKDMQAEICSADKICFHAQAVHPICILNDELVISDINTVFKKESLDQSIVDTLPKIYSSKNDQYEDIVVFIQSLPKELTQTCTISWLDKNLITFKPQKYENIHCLVSSSLIPTTQLFQNCYELYDQKFKKNLKKNNSKVMVEYDLRFKNQIIVKSGGKYG